MTDKLIGIGLMIAGVAIWSIDYFILKALSSIGMWLATLMNAPAEVGLGITILICLLCFGILSIVVILGACVVWCGIQFFNE